MTTGLFTTFLLLLIVIVLLAASLKIANENERFAEFVLGRFAGFKGPGLLFRSPTSKMVRLSIGDDGVVRNAEFVTFGDTDVPISSAASFRTGDKVRIDGFDSNEPRLVASSTESKHNCPKCGHTF